MLVKRAWCWLWGHGEEKVEMDGKGAAWTVCQRCDTVTHTHSFHGGKPWLTR